MPHSSDLRARLGAAVADGDPGLAAADRLCRACVEVLGVDGAAVSIVSDGVMQGTFGCSGELSRRLDEFQFTFGEGPCLDSVRDSQPVLVGDLRDPDERRWPAYAEAVLAAGVRAVYALPVPFARTHVGALDLFRNTPQALGRLGLAGGFIAAELAAGPLLDVLAATSLGPLDRLEVHQATGMVMAQLDVGPAEALVRIRGHAFSHGLTAADTARRIVARELVLVADPRGSGGGADTGGRS